MHQIIETTCNRLFRAVASQDPTLAHLRITTEGNKVRGAEASPASLAAAVPFALMA